MVVPHMVSLYIRLTILSVALHTMMSSNDKKRFKRFIHVTSPKFSVVIGKHAYEFLIDC